MGTLTEEDSFVESEVLPSSSPVFTVGLASCRDEYVREDGCVWQGLCCCLTLDE